jgi:hypothetical protein
MRDNMSTEVNKDIWLTLFSSTGLFIMAALLMFAKSLLDVKIFKTEEKEVQTEVEKAVKHFDEIDTSDVLKLMRRNVAELKEYYTINKQQARNAFTSALIVCFLGFILFAAGVIASYVSKDNNIIIYSTVSGTIVEVVSGLFFWLYSKSLKQINLFHESLRKTEKFLTAVQLAERITESKKDKIYTYIIENILGEGKMSETQLVE